MDPLFGTTQKILIVDDEANLRHTLALILRRAGYAVTTAGSVDEARQILKNEGFNLIFLDLKMPDEDGLVLLPEIHRKSAELPVIILTAHATLESAIEAVRHGARDYLIKPIDPTNFLARVSEVLAESEHPRKKQRLMAEIQGLLTELNEMEGQPDLAPREMNRQSAQPGRYFQRGQFTLDLHARNVILGDHIILLSPTAFDYLLTLLKHAPNPVSYEALVMESQGYKTSLIEARDLARWRIHELRKALESDLRRPQYIITVRGTGYRLLV